MRPRSQPADDAHAFAIAAESAYRPMVRYAASLAGPDLAPYLAEDAAQEALVKAWRYLDSFDGRGSLEGWLLRICRHCTYDMLRREGLHKDRSERLERPQTVRPHAAVDLEILIDGLPLAEREAFVLTQVVELGYEDAAAVLDVPVGTVKSRVARARLQLSRELRTAEAS